MAVPVIGPIAFMLFWTHFTRWKDEQARHEWRRATMLAGFMMMVMLAIGG